MKLLVGLGNPGPRYASSRHNVGWRVIDRVAQTHGVPLSQARFLGRYGEGALRAPPDEGRAAAARSLGPIGLLEPTTFMNESGRSIAAAIAELPGISPSDDLLVVYDDLDLPLGRIRLRPAGGAGGHRGVTSVIVALGTRSFARLRFGIGRPPEGQEILDFVLEPFSASEESLVAGRVVTAAAASQVALLDGVRAAMDRFNRATEPDVPDETCRPDGPQDDREP